MLTLDAEHQAITLLERESLTHGAGDGDLAF
jgi:hypothetical protein